MRRVLAVVLALVLLVPVGQPAVGVQDDGEGFASLLQTGDVDPDRVSLRAAVSPDGSAEWRIAYRVRLDDENATEAFESLRRDVEANESAYADQFAARMRSTVATAENATGREMAVRNVSVTAQRDPFQDFGVVAYTFTWDGFAATDGDRLVVGDALAGLFLDQGTSLTVSWPAEYETRAVDPSPDERTETSVTWQGDRSFGPDQPFMTVAPASALSMRPMYLAVAGLALIAVLGAAWFGRQGTDLSSVPLLGDSGAGSAGPTADETEPEPPRQPATEAGGATAAGGEVGSGGETGTGTGTDADDGPPEELLSPRERVLRLVEGNGGRMKQAAVTDALGWSAARTSQVVGDLRDAGDLESFRLGRENVLRLPEGVDDADDGPST
ncbi:hypothetical protein HUG10_12670 [Halorarum halophilum]|uniref:DUF4897 domain-containing protein n=1 Tax=Halorarum halophilum TaxID=2743090 RepID=A0A7D5GLX3_9EURY|nr:hypothetical protein [Halobaculum halophilum]QLG28347.1 hypothetical protein HUG10_12670 [Halobaculum halophilum]